MIETNVTKLVKFKSSFLKTSAISKIISDPLTKTAERTVLSKIISTLVNADVQITVLHETLNDHDWEYVIDPERVDKKNKNLRYKNDIVDFIDAFKSVIEYIRTRIRSLKSGSYKDDESDDCFIQNSEKSIKKSNKSKEKTSDSSDLSISNTKSDSGDACSDDDDESEKRSRKSKITKIKNKKEIITANKIISKSSSSIKSVKPSLGTVTSSRKFFHVDGYLLPRTHIADSSTNKLQKFIHLVINLYEPHLFTFSTKHSQYIIYFLSKNEPDYTLDYLLQKIEQKTIYSDLYALLFSSLLVRYKFKSYLIAKSVRKYVCLQNSIAEPIFIQCLMYICCFKPDFFVKKFVKNIIMKAIERNVDFMVNDKILDVFCSRFKIKNKVPFSKDEKDKPIYNDLFWFERPILDEIFDCFADDFVDFSRNDDN
ncbi:hypothetical protein EDEG_02896 [Edhazardia aedis USNM 41457]|uniref:Uncharacterized protein n=1 Tax=Edhazardia aedis (strain USNM 41457) TaxID=1003232 RepID=J9DMY5_EDHAE|nr:hypothetical protein EDEG_02896 [Edhazardia aedis USNM 41457]|eukprot:EJW02712.1 hypothetical protein EDEG_02896 [Edhazardia aedis USNM 41457]